MANTGSESTAQKPCGVGHQDILRRTAVSDQKILQQFLSEIDPGD